MSASEFFTNHEGVRRRDGEFGLVPGVACFSREAPDLSFLVLPGVTQENTQSSDPIAVHMCPESEAEWLVRIWKEYPLVVWILILLRIIISNEQGEQ